MNKKIIISIVLIILFVVGYLLNNAKNEYLKDQIFIELSKNVAAKTGNKIKVEIEDINCSGINDTYCELSNLNFYAITTEKEKMNIVKIDKIDGNINFINILLDKIENNFKIKNFHFDEEFLNKREFNPVINYDTQEMISVLKKYGNIDIDFYISKDGISDVTNFKLKVKNVLVNLNLDTQLNQFNGESNNDQDIMLENFKLVITKKDFNKNFFNVLKEREPGYFKKFSEDFLYQTVFSKYQKFVENKFLLNLNVISDFFFKDNISLEMKTEKDKIISVKEQLTPFLMIPMTGGADKRDFKEEMGKMSLEYNLK